MAWLFFVHGYCFQAETENGYDVREQVQADPEYQALSGEVGQHPNLILKCTVDSDDNQVAFFVGKDLMPGRHSYPGFTHAAGFASAEELTLAEGFAERLEAILVRVTGLSFFARSGAVLSQFD